jgi:hypothetical protein
MAMEGWVEIDPGFTALLADEYDLTSQSCVPWKQDGCSAFVATRIEESNWKKSIDDTLSGMKNRSYRTQVA